MVLWIMMLITQPFLIKYKQFSKHRLLGKISYLLVPLVIITSWLLIRNEYYRKVAYWQASNLNLSQTEVLMSSSQYPVAFIVTIWFVILYVLAIKYRKQSSKHARYMLATGLILLSPTLDRFVAINLGIEILSGIYSSLVSFLLMDLNL